jgi:hypothetical protein
MTDKETIKALRELIEAQTKHIQDLRATIRELIEVKKNPPTSKKVL